MERPLKRPLVEVVGKSGLRLKTHSAQAIAKGITLEDFSMKPISQDQRRLLEEKLTTSMEDLAQGVVRLVNICVANNIGAAVFTERSGLPMMDLFTIAWDKLLPEVEHPQVGTINIGRVRDLVNDDALPTPSTSEKEQIRRMHGFRKENIQRILGVDEHVDTGTTISHEQYVLREVYPDAKIFVTGVLDLPAPWGRGSIQTGLTDSTVSGNRFASNVIADAEQQLAAQEIRQKRNNAFSKLVDNILDYVEYVPIEDLGPDAKPKLPALVSDLVNL